MRRPRAAFFVFLGQDRRNRRDSFLNLRESTMKFSGPALFEIATTILAIHRLWGDRPAGVCAVKVQNIGRIRLRTLVRLGTWL